MESVYIVNGFLEAGKTTFIRELLDRDGIRNAGKILILVCEEGEEEYDPDFLKKRGITLAFLAKEEDFNEENIGRIEKKCRPDVVIVEFNGFWDRKNRELPWFWENVAEVVVFDASSFKLYVNNLRSFLAEQVKKAGIVLFNRCDEVRDSLAGFTRNIKAINPGILFMYRGSEGDIFLDQNERLPYDISRDELVLDDQGFLSFCLDIHDRQEVYEGKTVRFIAQAFQTKTDDEAEFVAGRFVMTCCETDRTFMGILCAYVGADRLTHREWVEVTGRIRIVNDEVSGKEIPVCLVKELSIAHDREETITMAL